ncbi:MAG: hypothetical protein FIB06_05560 [Betaproteobacteria bacterium]|nr:hypothetical protein [Betaproteobacteria bacterium]
MKTIFLIAFSVVLTACTTPRANYSPVPQAISEPPLNSISTVSVGDTMLRQGEFTEHEAIFVPAAIPAGLYTIQPGYYLKTGEDGSTEFYYPGGPQAGRVDKPAIADNWSNVIIRNGNPTQICVLTVYGLAITTCNSENKFKRQKVDGFQRDSFQQTLIYSGKSGNKINIAYREFSNSLARPAFNNNVEYDLSDSKIIAYKGAQLEILEATNQHIKFKLLKNFNAAVR